MRRLKVCSWCILLIAILLLAIWVWRSATAGSKTAQAGLQRSTSPLSTTSSLPTDSSVPATAGVRHSDSFETLVAGTDMPVAPKLYRVQGSVLDVVSISEVEEFFARVEASTRPEEFENALNSDGMEPRPAAGVAVELRGGAFSARTHTDAQGTYVFSLVPEGEYEVIAEKPAVSPFTGRKAAAVDMRKVVVRGDTTVRQQLDTELVTLRGRITDELGQPVAGARVTAVQPVVSENFPDPGEYPPVTNSAVSGADGTYEIVGLRASDFFRNAQAIAKVGVGPSYVIVEVRANQYQQDGENRPRVPLLTEDLLVPARRMQKQLIRFARMSGNAMVGEVDISLLPGSRGNTIMDVNIVMKQTVK